MEAENDGANPHIPAFSSTIQISLATNVGPPAIDMSTKKEFVFKMVQD